MAGAVVQVAYGVDDSGTTSTTLSATLTGVTSGNHIVAHPGWGDSTATSSVSDGTSFGAAVDSRPDATNNENSAVFLRENVSGGTHVVVATFSTAVPFRRLRLVEVSGCASSGSLDKATGQVQLAPGTGANAVSSGATAATTNANNFNIVLTQCTSALDPGSGTMTADSAGYTLATTAATVIMAVESINVAATGAQTGRFTQSVANDRITHLLSLKQASGASTVAAPARQTFHPGRSPGKAPQSARFYQSPRAANAVSANTDATLPLTGQTATFSLGTITATVSYALTGQTITSSLGAPLLAVSYGVAAQTATFAEGVVAPFVSYGLTAQTAAFTEGAAALTVAYGITAQAATFTEGALAVNVGYGLTGQTAPFTEGAITATQGGDVTITLSGQTATFSLGTVTPSISYGLNAQTATFAEGAPSATVAYGVAAQTATFTEGAMSASMALALTGQIATFAEGVVAPNISYAAGTQTATFTAGSVTRDVSYGLSAQTATFTEGTITPLVPGDVTIQLGSLTATFSLGVITASGGDQPAPAQTGAIGGGGSSHRGSNPREILRLRKKDEDFTEELRQMYRRIVKSDLSVLAQKAEAIVTAATPRVDAPEVSIAELPPAQQDEQIAKLTALKIDLEIALRLVHAELEQEEEEEDMQLINIILQVI